MEATDLEQNHWSSDRSYTPLTGHSPARNLQDKSGEKIAEREEQETFLGTLGGRRLSVQSLHSASDEMELDKMASDSELTDDEETGLTNQHRTRRKRRKRKNTSLDERVARGTHDNKTSKHDRKLADMSVLKSSAVNVLLIGLWLVSWAMHICMYLRVCYLGISSLSRYLL